MLTYLAIAERFKPQWLVWENVPGVLSSNRGRDFGTFLGALAKLGYGWAYRVLDAQWFGLAQRRRRVFVVGCLGDTSRAAKVLFESESVCRDSAPSREKGQGAARSIRAQSQSSHREDSDNFVAECLMTGTGQRYDAETETLTPTHGGGFDVAPLAFDTTQITSPGNFSNPKPGDACHPLAAGAHPPAMAMASAVRRLTPRECERLQGFPDDYTAIPWRKKDSEDCPDGPRYKALGNSMAVPVMHWIGKRIMVIG
jgi:DNA (cytosine-5)-methyltransferase 1